MLTPVQKNIVSQDVLAPVVLMKTAGLGRINDVVLEQDARAAFVRVKPPATVGIRLYVVDHVVPHRRALGRPQGVNAAQVTEQPPAKVVNVVVGDEVSFAVALPVTPAPAHADSRVEKIGDFVVRNLVVRAESDPDTDSAREDRTAMPDDVVINRDVQGGLGRFAWQFAVADPHPPCPEVMDEAVSQRAVL